MHSQVMTQDEWAKFMAVMVPYTDPHSEHFIDINVEDASNCFARTLREIWELDEVEETKRKFIPIEHVPPAMSEDERKLVRPTDDELAERAKTARETLKSHDSYLAAFHDKYRFCQKFGFWPTRGEEEDADLS